MDKGHVDPAPPATYGRIWDFIEQRIVEAELDGFLAAYFLSRYMGEDVHERLAAGLATLGDDYEFTRARVAMLGVALERAWLPATPEAIARFIEGFDRLDRQRPSLAPTAAYRNSIRLLWGIALGAQVPAIASTRQDLAPRVADALMTLLDGAHGRPRDRVVATAILADLQPERQRDHGRALARYVSSLDATALADLDAVAVLWALRHHCFLPDRPAMSDAESERLSDHLIPRLHHLTPIEDIVDAVVAYDLQTAYLRDAATGRRLAQDALSIVRRTIDTFPEIARRMRQRQHHRPPLLIENEYDVQDLLYVALKAHILDLSDKEWTPKDGGRVKRIDFVSNAARLCIEAKKTRDADHARGIGDEIKIDIESYYGHKSCDTLVVFIYDPDNYMIDARRQEMQLSGQRTIKGRLLDVHVYIRPM